MKLNKIVRLVCINSTCIVANLIMTPLLIQALKFNNMLPLQNTIYTTVAGVIPTPPEIPPGDVSSTSVRVTWSVPPDANGVITHYTVNLRALLLKIKIPNWRRRQVDGDEFNNCVTGEIVQNTTVPGNTSEAQLQKLSE